MSDSVALYPLPLPDEASKPSSPRLGFGALLKAALTSLVAAQTRRFEETGPLMSRFPPL
jgi:hypothetical protein